MRKAVVAVSFAAAMAFAAALAAHEGHVHKVMGTVAVVDQTHLEIDAKDGGKVSVLLTPQTKYFKGKVTASVGDVKVGHRVVVTMVEEAGKKKATEVLMGTGGTAPAAKPGAKP